MPNLAPSFKCLICISKLQVIRIKTNRMYGISTNNTSLSDTVRYLVTVIEYTLAMLSTPSAIQQNWKSGIFQAQTTYEMWMKCNVCRNNNLKQAPQPSWRLVMAYTFKKKILHFQSKYLNLASLLHKMTNILSSSISVNMSTINHKLCSRSRPI